MPPKKRTRLDDAVPLHVVDTMGLTNLNEMQLNKWVRLCRPKREISVTKFACIPALTHLGLLADMSSLLKRGHMENFLAKNAKTYRRYTLEFLATVQRHDADEESEEEYITCNINDVQWQITYSRLRKIFGFDDPFDNRSDVLAPVTEAFWCDLTDIPYEHDCFRPSNIPHPVWRLIYRIQSTTIYGFGEPSKFNSTVVKNLHSLLKSGPPSPDWVDIFVRRCEEVGTKSAGNITMGGMITLIFEAFMRGPHSVDARLVEPRGMQDPHLYTLNNLVKVEKFEVKSRDSYFWRFGPGVQFRCTLPRPPDSRPLPSGSIAERWFMGEEYDEPNQFQQQHQAAQQPPQQRRRQQQQSSKQCNDWRPVVQDLQEQQQAMSMRMEDLYDQMMHQNANMELMMAYQRQILENQRTGEYQAVPEEAEEKARAQHHEYNIRWARRHGLAEP